MNLAKLNLAKLAIVGYVCIIVASAGYDGDYLPHSDSFVWMWVVIAFVGAIFLGYKNLAYFKATSDRRVFWDILIILLAFFLPAIPLPFGIPILIMMAVCLAFSLVLVNKMFQLWSK